MEVHLINPIGSGELYKKVILNQAEIQALNTTPLEILPVPAEHKTYQLRHGSIAHDTSVNDTAFAGVLSGIQAQFTGGAEFFNVADGFLEETLNHKTPILPTVYDGTDKLPSDEAVEVTAGNDMTLGDPASTVTIEIYYKVIPG